MPITGAWIGDSVQETLAAATEGTAAADGTQVATFTSDNTSDPASAYVATIDWGDGTTTTGTLTGSNGAFTVLGPVGGHIYADEGNETVSVTVTRPADGTVSTGAGTVAVAEGDVLTAQPSTFTATSNIAFNGAVATFTDTNLINLPGDFAATINWGDATTTVGTVTGSNGLFTVSGTHTYMAAGTDVVTVTLTDDAPAATAPANSTANVGTVLTVQETLAAATAGTAAADGTPIVGLPADRLYDWNPGLDSVGGIPDRTTVFTTVNPGGDIQAAIDACPPGEVVQLAAGTFTVNNYLLIDKGITLRGAVDPVTNAPLTFLQKTNGATPGSYTAPDYQPIIIVGPGRYGLNSTGTSTNLTSDAVAGTYSITLASTAGLSPGQFVLLDENDYTSASFIPLPNRNGSPTSAEILASDRVVFQDHNPSDPGDDPFPDSLTWFSRMGRPLNEIKEIASISGNTVTFTSPITIDYTVSKTAQLTSLDPFVQDAGIENLSLKGGSDGNVRFQDTAYSWMKNVDDTGWLGEGVAIDSSFRDEVEGSYIHDGAWPAPGGGGYAISLAWGSAEALIENNIILRANKMMVGRSAGAGTVVAYNYADDGFINYDPSWQEVGINGSHMVGSHSWLFEGNESFNYDSDNTHGNAIYMTVFRNDLTGQRTDFPSPDSNARAVGLMFGSWWQTIIGNVLGTPGMTGWTYQSPGLGNQWGNDNIWEIGYDPQHWEQDADPKTVSTLIRGGNYDYVTNSVHWENIPSQALPPSLYLSSKPAFFGSYTWPWVDPTGSTQLYILPAKARYDAGTPFALPPTVMIANNDSGLVASENTTLSIPASTLLANDTDPNGLSLSIVGVSNPSNGTVSYNASTQTVSFAPNNNYLGPASFTYTITDGQASASANVSLTVNYPITAQSLFNPSDTPATVTANDPNSVELGVKFQASTNGTITGIRFYKGPQNTGTDVADLWSATGTLLATATFTNETASGWQQVNLANPVVVTAGTTYVVSYHTSGYYSATSNYFATAHTNGSLTALASGTSGGDGVYAYGTGSIFPTNSFNASNYWVDVVFNGASLQPPVEYDAGTPFLLPASPPVLTISALVGQPVNGSAIEVKGTGVAGDTVMLYVDGGTTPVGTGTVAADGSFDISTSTTFADGSHTLVATQADAMGVTSTTSNSFAVAVDPSAPTILSLVDQVNGSVAQVTDVKGTGEAGDTLTLYADGGTTPVGTGTVAANGDFDIITSTTFADGLHTLTATQTDAAGLTSAASPDFAVTVAPTTTLVASENTTLSIPASTLLANDTDPNGLSLSIVGVSNPSNGTVSYNASTQTVSFAPNNNYLGPASFTYTITDGQASASANVSLTVNYPITAQSLFNPSDTPATVTANDPNSVELGVKFQASTNGTITGIRFYKGPQNTGTDVADLWSATGTLLATATFTNETASGWQQVNLANPVVVTAGTTYVVSYHTSGYYSATSNYFATAHTNGSLTALASGTSGGDGVYAYGTGSIFPTNSFNASNYWVDVVFNGASLQPPVEYDAGTPFLLPASPPVLTISALVGQPVNGSAIEVKGTGVAGDTVMLYVDGGTTPVGTGTVAADGSFDISTSTTFADGSHTLVATQADAMGVTSTTSNSFAVAVDPSAPTILSLVDQVNGSVAQVTDVKGTGEAGDTLTLYADGGTTPVGTGTVAANGDFDIITSTTFADGLHTLTATQTDAAGLTSAASPDFAVTVAPTTTVISEVGNHFFLDDSSGSGPSLKLGGTDVVAGLFGAWSPFGAVQTASGYEVAWKNPGANQYNVWTTDSGGNFLSQTGVVSGTDYTLESLESTFGQDLNGDGITGLTKTVIQTDGPTSLTAAANHFFLDDSSGSGPSLKLGGTDVVAGLFGAWSPFGAVQTASGYEVAWKNPGANQYNVWTTDSGGNFLSQTGVVSGTDYTLESLESTFGQDLNGDGITGLTKTVIQTDGPTSLTAAANHFFLDDSSGSGPSLKLGGTDVVAGLFGAWSPFGAVQTASGYEVAWKNPGANQYNVWTTDSGGNFLSQTGVVSGTDYTLESLESTFGQDLNGDGLIGSSTIGASDTLKVVSTYSGQVSFTASTGTLELLNSSNFAGTVAGMAGNDTIDFADIDPTKVQQPNYSGTPESGTLTVTDGTHAANIALLGNYMASVFVPSSDGHGGTSVVDPPALGGVQPLVTPPHA